MKNNNYSKEQSTQYGKSGYFEHRLVTSYLNAHTELMFKNSLVTEEKMNRELWDIGQQMLSNEFFGNPFAYRQMEWYEASDFNEFVKKNQWLLREDIMSEMNRLHLSFSTNDKKNIINAPFKEIW